MLVDGGLAIEEKASGLLWFEDELATMTKKLSRKKRSGLSPFVPDRCSMGETKTTFKVHPRGKTP